MLAKSSCAADTDISLQQTFLFAPAATHFSVAWRYSKNASNQSCCHAGAIYRCSGSGLAWSARRECCSWRRSREVHEVLQCSLDCGRHHKGCGQQDCQGTKAFSLLLKHYPAAMHVHARSWLYKCTVGLNHLDEKCLCVLRLHAMFGLFCDKLYRWHRYTWHS